MRTWSSDGPLRLEDADDAERDPADEDVRPDRLGAEPEVVGRRRAEDGDPQLLGDGDVGEERPLPDLVRPDRQVVGGRAGDRRRRVRGAGNDDRLRGHVRGDGGNAGHAGDGRRVVERQRRRAARPHPHEAAGQRARLDREQVRAEPLDPAGDAARRSLGHADEGDDRADADDDAEHREDGPHAGGRKPRHGELDQLQVSHRPRVLTPPAARRGRGPGASRRRPRRSRG